MPPPSLGYEVVTSQVTVLLDNGDIGVQSFSLSAPVGKVPVGAGYKMSLIPNLSAPQAFDDYPEGNSWVFRFFGSSSNSHTVDLYVVVVEP